MSSPSASPLPEIPLTLTPQQAAQGVIITVRLPTGPEHLTVRPCRDGELVAARLGEGTVYLRIKVAGAPRKSGGLGCLAVLVVLGALAGGAFLLTDDGDGTPSATPATSTSTPYETPATTPYTPPAYTPTYVPSYTPSLRPSYRPTPVTTPTAERPDPYERGTCLNGRLPDSTTPRSVTGVDEVPCTAADAHYRVIQTFPFTSDMNKCEANPRTQYAFSHRYTMNGRVVSQYVYCLIGLGSYAR
ncbi:MULTISPECIES: hypothetical protein [unclassified Streptomyces]|uniref:LppU/SCO3897 family protein n=1 Tax=unclassified Streptomyces TaxID=2593676 RepID=UPI003685CA2C